MRKVCVFLCLSFFISLIHAASMPVFVSDLHHAHQYKAATHVDNADSHMQHKQCNDCTSSIEKSAKKVATKCHTASQCCVGIADLTASSSVIAPLQYADNLLPYAPTLALGQSLGNIYKPPRI